MAAGSRAAWDQFSRDVFGDPYLVWHEGPDFATLRERWAGQPDHVAAMLQTGLRHGDPVAAEAIRFLGPRRDVFERALRSALVESRGTFRVRVAEALFALTGDQDCAQAICDVLHGARHWGERVDAAIALGVFPPTRRIVESLRRGVQDREHLVRRHSAQALLACNGRKGCIEERASLFAKISSDDPASWRSAVDDLPG